MKTEDEIHKIIDSTFYETQKLISYEIAFHRCKIKECADSKNDSDVYFRIMQIERLKDSRVELKFMYTTLRNRLTFENEG